MNSKASCSNPECVTCSASAFTTAIVCTWTLSALLHEPWLQLKLSEERSNGFVLRIWSNCSFLFWKYRRARAVAVSGRPASTSHRSQGAVCQAQWPAGQCRGQCSGLRWQNKSWATPSARYPGKISSGGLPLIGASKGVCMRAKLLQSCLTLCDPMDCGCHALFQGQGSPPSHGTLDSEGEGQHLQWRSLTGGCSQDS